MTVTDPFSHGRIDSATPGPRVAGLDGAIAEALRQALAAPATRIARIGTGERAPWLKRVERHRSLRWLLQKGNPVAAFEAERSAHHRLLDLGVPVAPLIAEGPDWVLSADAGPTLEQVLTDPATTPFARAAVLAAAARTLAALHARGIRHGRPKLRDLCRSGADSITLLDFERVRENAGALQRGLDAAILVHSVLESLDGHPEAANLALHTLDSYREAAPAECWQGLHRAVRRFSWLTPVIHVLARRRPDRAEFRAMLALPGVVARAR